MNKYLSIIIPCYNNAAYIEQSVESAINQTYKKKEIIIIDDGSNLETKKVLKKLEPHVKKLITQENSGQSAARNRGIKCAIGEYILPLDSDDFFEPTFSEKAINVMENDTEVKLVTCYANIIYPDARNELFIPKGGDIKNFVKFSASLSNSMYRKSSWQLVEGYDELMRAGWEDWEFFIRLMSGGGRTHVIPEALFNYRRLSASTTSKANLNKYHLWRYIYRKNETIFKSHMDELVDHLLHRIENEESNVKKINSSLEYRIGQLLLLPFRKMKKIF